MIDAPILHYLSQIGAKVSPCGSRVTCDPPPFDTDEDWLVHLPWHIADKKSVADVVNVITGEGYEMEGSEHYQDLAANTGRNFLSLRKGEVNIILSNNDEWVRKHKLATALCKRLNLLNKPDRILVFQTVLYDNTNWGLPDPVEEEIVF